MYYQNGFFNKQYARYNRGKENMRAREKTIVVNGEEMTVHRIDNDYYGNPRYVVHFLALGLNDYESSKLTREAGLKIYRAKWYGGGFVVQSYNIEAAIKFAMDKIKEAQKNEN